jgi:hypothetical protein
MTMMINVRFGPYLVALSAPVTLGQLWTAAAASAAAVAVAEVAAEAADSALSAQAAAAVAAQADDDGADSGALWTAAAVTVTDRGDDGRCDSFVATVPAGRRKHERFPFGFPAVSVAAGATGFWWGISSAFWLVGGGGWVTGGVTVATRKCFSRRRWIKSQKKKKCISAKSTVTSVNVGFDECHCQPRR